MKTTSVCHVDAAASKRSCMSVFYKKDQNQSPFTFLFIYFVFIWMCATVSQTDICWHTYDILSSSKLNGFVTEKNKTKQKRNNKQNRV